MWAEIKGLSTDLGGARFLEEKYKLQRGLGWGLANILIILFNIYLDLTWL